jgi:hypothetical protein
MGDFSATDIVSSGADGRSDLLLNRSAENRIARRRATLMLASG